MSRPVLRTLIAIALFGTAALAGAQALGAPRPVKPVSKAAAAAATPRCFGAASLGTARPCRNPALSFMVQPVPRKARHSPNAPCTILSYVGALKPCAFGASVSSASETIALVGDSHAENWRGAVAYVARAKGWHGVSLALGGCPYSATTRVIDEPLRSHCAARNRDVPGWFLDHPQVHTVFVAQISGVPFVLPPGTPQFEGQVENYLKAWDALPATVRHIIVIRDTPKALPTTYRCVENAIAQKLVAGQACRMPRATVLDRDPAVVAARRAGSRVQVVNLVNHFCDTRWCYPVIGGALVQKDWNHLSATFIETLGPYLLQAVDQAQPVAAR